MTSGSMAGTPESPRLRWSDVATRVGLFIALAVIGGVAAELVPIQGILPRSVLYVFTAGVLANAIPVRIFEHARLDDFGLGWSDEAGRDLLRGLGYGAAAAASVVALMLLFDWVRFEPSPHDSAGAAISASVLLLFGAAGEEMMFHGYAFQLLVRYLGAFATILPVAVIFGLLHLSNPNATLLGAVNTMAWGVLLGFACFRTRALWLPIGIHFGWNVMLPLTGANMSGITMRITGYTLHEHAGSWLSGGAYGPEGSVLATVAAGVLFWRVMRDSPEDGLS